MPKQKTLDKWQDGEDPNIADGGTASETDEREIIGEFEGVLIREQFVSLTGATMMELAEKLRHGDEVVLEITGKVQKGELITRERNRREGGPEETVLNRKIKVSDVKLVRATSQMF